VLLSNPDMLHYALLPYAAGRLWDWFFSSLEYVVIDEVHSYRGVFGSQVAMTLRRLARTCERFGSSPQFVCCSATINNPVEHVATVTGRDPTGITLSSRTPRVAGRATGCCGTRRSTTTTGRSAGAAVGSRATRRANGSSSTS